MTKLLIVILGLFLVAAGCTNGLLGRNSPKEDSFKDDYCPTPEALATREKLLEADKDNSQKIIMAVLEFTELQFNKEFLDRKLPRGTTEVYFKTEEGGGGGARVESQTTFREMLDYYNQAASYSIPDVPTYGILSVQLEASAKDILEVKASLPKSYVGQIVRPEDLEKEKQLREAGGKTIYPQGLILDCDFE